MTEAKNPEAPKEIPKPAQPQKVSTDPLKVIDKSISTYNGDKTDRYNWS